MIWGALAILLSSLYLSPVLACDVDELAFKGKSVDFRDSRLLNLPARSERFGLWLAVEYEGVRALGLSRYVTVDHSQLDRRLKKFFGGYYKYPQSWWPDLTYLAGGEFHAVNDKNHAALARVREVHDSCGFLKGPRSKHREKPNPPEVFFNMAPNWLTEGAQIQRVSEEVAHVHPRLGQGVNARHDLPKASYTIHLMMKLYWWVPDRQDPQTLRSTIFSEKLKGFDLVTLGQIHAELLRADDFEFLPEGSQDAPSGITQSGFRRWEWLLARLQERALTAAEYDELGTLAERVNRASSDFDSRSGSGEGIEVLLLR